MRYRLGMWIVGGVLILTGILLPRDWYDALPERSGLPDPPIKGITVLQISLLVEGGLVFLLSFKRWTFTRTRVSDRLQIRPVNDVPARSDGTRQLVPLVLITLLGLTLRLISINSDLWLDEITPILDYGHLTWIQTLGTYLGTNNHLLNTFLVKLSSNLFGQSESAIRLPAVLFGTATIPLLYWFARPMMSRHASLGAALLSTVSYHLVFFSQNARGYSAYIFFSLLSVGLLTRALQEDRLGLWAWYAVATFFSLATIPIAIFIFAGNLLLAGLVLGSAKHQHKSVLPLSRHMIVASGVSVFLGFQLYALILPKVAMMERVYLSPATGFDPFSVEFLNELLRGISAGFANGTVGYALPVLIVGAVIAIGGLLILWGRHWPLVLGIGAPLVITAVTLIVRGLTFSPRFFLLALPLTFLALSQGLFSFAERLPKAKHFSPRVLPAIMILLVSGVSATSLRNYYSTPKQPYRASIEFVENESHRNDIVVVVINTAEKGIRFYGERMGLDMGPEGNYRFIRTLDALEDVLTQHVNKDVYLVTTFRRALHLDLPDVEERIRAGWTVTKEFQATIGDGQIAVWKPI